VSEHDFEAVRGLPGQLPAGETLIWQGAPRWFNLARQSFHIGAVTAYFAAMLAWRTGAAIVGGTPPLTALRTSLLVTPIALVAIGLLALLAWLTARTTVYTITTKRVVLRFGLALPKAINIPFGIIEAAAAKTLSDGSGDLALSLKAPNKVAFLQLWPHARPWRLTSPQPTFRAIADPQAAGQLLAAAMKGEVAIELTRTPAPVRDQTSAVAGRPEAAAA
jgi:hypothetical protein